MKSHKGKTWSKSWWEAQSFCFLHFWSDQVTWDGRRYLTINAYNTSNLTQYALNFSCNYLQGEPPIAICGKSWDLVKHNIGNMSLCNQVMKNFNCFVHIECLSIQWNSNFAPHFLQHLYIIYISLEKYKYKSQVGRKWVDDALKTPCIWNEWTNKSEKVWNLTQPEKYSKQSRNNSDGKDVGKHVTMCLEKYFA